MKNFTLLFLLIAAVTVTSCKKSEEEKNKGEIVAKWYLQKVVTTYYEGTKIVEQNTEAEFDSDDFIEFKSNGTAIGDDTFTYKISGNKLSMTEDNGDTDVWEIKKISDRELILFLVEEDGNDKSTIEMTLNKK